MTLRDRKKAQTRERIVSEAMQLFERQGFEQTTVDEIARAAEVGRRTFFRYFPTKEAVVFPDWERRLEEFRKRLTDSSAGEASAWTLSGLEAVRRALLVLTEEYGARQEELFAQRRLLEGSAALLASEFRQDRLWEGAIAHALGDRSGRGAAARRRARLAAGAVMGAIRAALGEWHRSGGKTNLSTLGEEAFALLSAGVPSRDKGE